MRPKKSLGTVAVLRPKKVLDLRGSDQHRDAVGEPDGHRPRNELDRRAQPGDAHDHQQNARHDGHHGQARHAEPGDDSGHDDDERARRTADLRARSAQRGDQEVRRTTAV